MRRALFIVMMILGPGIAVPVQSQVSFLLGQEETDNRISGNGISDVLFGNGALWVATGSGLSRTENSGAQWTLFDEMDGIGKPGISAIAVSDGIIWVATSFDTVTRDQGLLPAGGGLSYSNDNGLNWVLIDQPGATPVQNITFDIVFVDSSVWITSWGGGLRRSDNNGQSWLTVAPDNQPFDTFLNLNHRAFSAVYADSVLWVGTAQGINRSVDQGLNWVNFNHQNQTEPISGNFVVALAHQEWRGRKILWAATVEAEDQDEIRGVSYSEDLGFTWKTALPGVFAHNFAFADSTVYVAADLGLYKSNDFGETWASFNNIVDSETGALLLTDEVFSAVKSPDGFLWVGSKGGLARTGDEGATWRIFRGFEPLADNDNVSETYAYPNPFSPLRHNQFGGEGHVRFHYRVRESGNVTLRVFDFAMILVRRVEDGVFRLGDSEYDAIWDGRNDFGERVANGLYYYRVDLPGSDPVWGKVIVLD